MTEEELCNIEFDNNPYTFGNDGAKVVGAFQSGFYKGVRIGEKAQKKVDIEKACEWWEKVLLHSALDISHEQILFYQEHFIKAMEE